MGVFFGINIRISIGTDVDRVGTIIIVIIARIHKLMILKSMLFINTTIIHHSSFNYVSPATRHLSSHAIVVYGINVGT